MSSSVYQKSFVYYNANVTLVERMEGTQFRPCRERVNHVTIILFRENVVAIAGLLNQIARLVQLDTKEFLLHEIVKDQATRVTDFVNTFLRKIPMAVTFRNICSTFSRNEEEHILLLHVSHKFSSPTAFFICVCISYWKYLLHHL